MEPTSKTEMSGYPDFCKQASKDPQLFKSFRRHPICVKALEHVTYGLAKECIKIIKLQAPYLIKHKENIKKNDAVGRPRKRFFWSFGKIAPTTVRYVKTISDILEFVDDMSKFKIVEIGGGYGGLCAIISSIFNIESYTIVDLPPVLALQQKYLDAIGTNSVSFYGPDDLDKIEKFDLCISNYAFSELRKDVQDLYLSKILTKSRSGIMWYNKIGRKWFDSYSEEDLKKHIEHLVVHRDGSFFTQVDRRYENTLVTW